MLSREILKELVHVDSRTKIEILLLCLALDDIRPRSVTFLRELALELGIRSAQKWNISDILARSKGRAIRGSQGWELGAKGVSEIEILSEGRMRAIAPKVADSLSDALMKIKDPEVRRFAEEAVACFRTRQYRAAVVFSWVGAISLLHEQVLEHDLPAFNAEAKRRNIKWRTAKTRDDLALMGEHDLLQVLESISIIGKSVKHELEGCLKLRNGCGHPNSLQVGESRVSAHIEILMLNVYSKIAP